MKRRASEKLPLAVVPVDMNPGKPPLNLTLVEGADIKETGKLITEYTYMYLYAI